MYKMKHESDWDTASTSDDTLKFMAFIEKTIFYQTEDQHPFTTVYEKEVVFYNFHQHNLTNDQWYERFNTKVDIGSAIGATRQHKILLEYVDQESNIKHDDIPKEEQ